MTQRAEPRTPTATVEFDYRSDDGPVVTHVRGALLASSLQMLRASDLYDRYLTQLPAQYREQVTYSIASSWIPMEVARAHVATLDALKFSESALAQQGERVGLHWGNVLYSVVLKTTRTLGADLGWLILRQSGRLMQRVYKGGGCTLLKLGPKDAVLEIHGLPLVEYPYFRATHQASMRSIAGILGGSGVVRPARPREAHPWRIATSLSWV